MCYLVLNASVNEYHSLLINKYTCIKHNIMSMCHEYSKLSSNDRRC